MSRIYVDKMPEKPSDCPFCSDDGVTLKCCKIMGNKHACDLETGLDCDYLAELPKDLKPERIIVEPPQLNGMK